MTGAKPWTGDTPYPGNRPFELADHDRFFGRTKESAALAEMWQDSQLSLVVGPAGIGKTSLLQAGVLPLVNAGHANVLPTGRISHGAAFPWAALPSQNPFSIALLSSWSPGTPPTRLAGITVGDFIGRRAERQEGPILAIIDQAEELLTDSGPRWSHRRRFLEGLREALNQYPRLHLLLIARDEASALLGDAFGPCSRHDVGPLSRDDALDAVTGPLARSGRAYGPGAAAVLVSDLQTSNLIGADGAERVSVSDSVEPALLQVSCDRLWRCLPGNHEVVTAQDIRRYGDVSSGLSAFCGHALATVAEEHEMTAPRLRRWLLRTFVTADGGRTGAYEGPARTQGMTNAVVRALEDQHLLHASRRSGSRSRYYELLSDRLIEPLRDAVTTPTAGSPPDSYLRAAERTLSLSDLDSAERYARLTLRAVGEADLRLRAEASSLLGNIAYEREKPSDAAPWYRKAAEEFGAVSDSAAVAYQLAAVGQTLIDQGQLGDARDQLLKAANRGPDDAILQTGLARALWRLGEGRAAVAILDGALGIDAGNREAIGTRGEILADLGDARAALRDLTRMTKPMDPSVQAARGLALAQIGDHEAASLDIQAALNAAQQNGFVLLCAARVAEQTSRAAAADLARRAMDAMDLALSPHHQAEAQRLYHASDVDRG
jgi:tetratricopeptide (TPR) repeat protein